MKPSNENLFERIIIIYEICSKREALLLLNAIMYQKRSSDRRSQYEFVFSLSLMNFGEGTFAADKEQWMTSEVESMQTAVSGLQLISLETRVRQLIQCRLIG